MIGNIVESKNQNDRRRSR